MTDVEHKLVASVTRLIEVLETCGCDRDASILQAVLELPMGSPEFYQRASSVDIWGGSGSLFDQAFVGSGIIHYRRIFLRELLAFGLLLQRAGHSTRFVDSAVQVLRELQNL